MFVVVDHTGCTRLHRQAEKDIHHQKQEDRKVEHRHCLDKMDTRSLEHHHSLLHRNLRNRHRLSNN